MWLMYGCAGRHKAGPGDWVMIWPPRTVNATAIRALTAEATRNGLPQRWCQCCTCQQSGAVQKPNLSRLFQAALQWQHEVCIRFWDPKLCLLAASIDL